MISVHFQDKPFNITVLQVYAPTSNTEEDEIEQFYDDLDGKRNPTLNTAQAPTELPAPLQRPRPALGAAIQRGAKSETPRAPAANGAPRGKAVSITHH